MGSISRFNLLQIKKDYKTNFFFETGTWKGDAIQVALDSGFEKILSTEIIPNLALEAQNRFSSNPRVRIIEGDSASALKNELPALNGRCVFWLDAHFPGADAGMKKYDEEKNQDRRLPLESELKAISELRKKGRDVIIIDDLRIYEDGPFKNGNAPRDVLPQRNRNINFVYKFFSSTHTIHKFYSDEGYILLLPKRKFNWFVGNRFRQNNRAPLYILE
jgi:hypothetical protein